MASDNIQWADAEKIFLKILESNRKGLFLATLPYKIGITAALVAGFASIPMIFELNTVMWFNELYVTSGQPRTTLK
jgi:hypothetical protein